MLTLICILAVEALFAVLYMPFGEWLLHRYLMHRPCPWLGNYPFNAHARVHHQIFKADATYHLLNKGDQDTIPMAWWNGPVIVAVWTLPTVLVGWIISMNMPLIPWWQLPLVTFVVGLGYYGTYEFLHWCFHLPKSPQPRWVEKQWWFRKLNGHHILHHQYMHKNFNVVLPIADWVFDTLMCEASNPFRQVQGAAVPNVQPQSHRKM